MPLMDEFREERARIKKEGTPKEKAAYFWEYYKWYVIVPLIALILIGYYVHHLVTKTDPALSGLLINATTAEVRTPADEIADDFSEKMEIDTKEYSINLNTSLTYFPNSTSGTSNYEASQAIMAWIAAGTIDFITADWDTMTEFSYRQYFSDLRDVLSEEEIARYEPYFLYMDQAVLEAREKAIDENLDIDIEFPDCGSPENMERPIPVMIDMSKSGILPELYSGSRPVAFGIVSNAPHVDMTLSFLDYLMK